MATQSNPMPNGGSIANSVFFVFCMQHVFGWTKEGDEEGAGVGKRVGGKVGRVLGR